MARAIQLLPIQVQLMNKEGEPSWALNVMSNIIKS